MKTVTDLKIDRVNLLMNATSLEEAWLELLSVVHEIGFDRLIYATNRLRGVTQSRKRADAFLISDCPHEFVEPLWGENLYLDTPVCKWLMVNEGAMSLRYGSELYHANELTPVERAAQLNLMKAGVTSGYVIGFNKPNSAVVSGVGLLNFGLTQEEADEIWDIHGPEIEAYCHIFHLKASTLPVPIKHKTLTKRQQEVLRWVGSGKTSAEVATILGLSAAAIEKHLKRVREILNVGTTTQAVLHAEINSHIFSISPED